MSKTPMMRQWEGIKAQNPDALLLFRMGDFYELFGEDAVVAAHELDLTLTSRDKSTNAQKMCGVPYHAAERYIAQLVAKGFRCAICDQVEDPKLAKGLVKREVVRVLSPGTVLEESYLHSVGAASANNYLAALAADKKGQCCGVAFLDLSTGEFLAGEVSIQAAENVQNQLALEDAPKSTFDAADQTPATEWLPLREELLRFAPAEVLVPQALRENGRLMGLLEQWGLRTTAFDAAGFENAADKLCAQFGTASLRGFGIEEMPLAQAAAALALDYVRETHLGKLAHVRRIAPIGGGETMALDHATRRNLELVQSLRDGSAKGTLFGLLDGTRTGAGSRLLRRWILQPLLSRPEIEKRLDAVNELRDNLLLRGDVRDLLKRIADIERLVSRVVTRQAGPRDLASLRTALQTLPALKSTLEKVQAEKLKDIAAQLNPAPELADLLARALVEEPPLLLSDSGIICTGYDVELDQIRAAAHDGKSWIARLEEQERARTGIKNLKVGFNNVFGYYIEITKSNLAQTPDDYTRKQTTANAERFITPELKEKEALILGAQERSQDLERKLFETLREQVATFALPLLETASALAHLDVFAGLAEVAARNDYVRPELTEESVLEIRSGRHPVVEAFLDSPFVPNDCRLDSESHQELIITGPNASGKSTFLRQVALITLMAQIGCFVPARAAKIGLVDRIFTRVGAQDDLATGQSTFTVEMNETANILNNATAKSLIILDEVGRGTSTYDGLSIAWAVAEYLHELGAKTLFATHYHHLNELEEQLPRVKNYRIAVKEEGEHIIFLRRIIRGGTDRSFGIQVARLAGLPRDVISRAGQLLELFSRERLQGREQEILATSAPVTKVKTRNLFEEEAAPAPENPAVEILRDLDVENLTPLESIVKLQELQKLARG
jgi:DNA mismatch repair protein MutS